MKKVFALFALVLLLAAGCGEVPTMPPAGEVPTPTIASYPAPATHTPAPPRPTLPTLTPRPIILPTPRPTYSGPPKETQVVTPMAPFPTPAFPTPPPGTPPADLGTIWYPYFPSPDSRPVLQAVLVDGQGRRWGELGLSVDLGLQRGFPGPWLTRLHASPDARALVADVQYGDVWARSFWIDPASGQAQPFTTDPHYEAFRFLAWGPGRQVFARVNDEIWLFDLDTQEHRAFAFPNSESNPTTVGSLAVSPDDLWVADAIVYIPTASHRVPDVEVGLQPLVGGDRISLAYVQVPGGAWVAGHSLIWSPDGQGLALTLITGINDADPSNDDTQLWLIDRGSGSATLLSHNLRLAAWSTDGLHIAFIRGKDSNLGQPSADLWLLDLATSTETRLTDYTNQRVTSLAWAPNGQQLAFAVATGDHGEIWITSLDGSQQYPVAGPTVPECPVIWLLVTEGGR